MKLISDKKFDLFPVKYRYIIYAVAMLILSAMQFVVSNFLSIAEVTPDLLLILCIWITISEGQFAGLFAGFFIGLFWDIISMQIIGSNAFSKTVAVFVAGFFYKEGKHEQILMSYMFIIISIVSSIAHNFVYFLFYLVPGQISFLSYFLKYVIANSIYTSFFAIFAILFKMPKNKLLFLKREKQ